MFRVSLRYQRFAYNFKEAELKWRHSGTAQTLQGSPKFYCLAQFPYPSGSIHLGHARVYFISDSIARYQRMRGKRVLHPIGWDSFGLPAQNAAIQRQTSPLTWTEENIAEMKDQLQELGLAFDWDRELATHQLEYYRWTQKLFQIMLRRGLAYKKEAEVNWDPVDQTVLANEQVDVNGRSWRSGALVEKRKLNQWFFKITEYAEELVKGLDGLNWPLQVKQMQRGWIGLKKGYVGTFKVKTWSAGKSPPSLQVFAPSIRDLDGCKFIVVPAPDSQEQSIGVGVHPATGQDIPIYSIKDSVYQGVDGFVGLPQKIPRDADIVRRHGFVLSTTEMLDPPSSNSVYKQKTIMLLRDWLVSRQRYWGAPIPTLDCPNCGTVPSQLPVVLPPISALRTNPLLSLQFRKCRCPRCRSASLRESDTLDTFVDSSWYFLRFLDPHNCEAMFSKEKTSWMGVDVYVGGVQHAIMHLLYSRFVYKVLFDQGLVSGDEPFSRLIDQGLVRGVTYKLANTHRYISKEQAGDYPKEQVVQTFEKMSKSKFNGVSPMTLTRKYGSDALRLALFGAPYDKDIDFTEEQVKHKADFINKVHNQLNKIQGYSESGPPSLPSNIQRVKQLVRDMEVSMDRYTLHVYTARVFELYNILKGWLEQATTQKSLVQQLYSVLVRVLYPVCPHLSSQLLHLIGQSAPTWPQMSRFQVQHPHINILVSINGKFVKKLQVPEQLSELNITAYLSRDPKLAKLMSEGVKQIYVRRTPNGQVINVVCK